MFTFLWQSQINNYSYFAIELTSNSEYSKKHSVFTTAIDAIEKNAYLMAMLFLVPLHGARFVLYAI
jgi:hypothetical protein